MLVLIEGSPHGYLRLVAASVMLTTAVYLPVESSHELTMAEALVSAGRAFIKPLRYNRDDGPVLPDFVLTDQPAPVFVEVWGVPGRADYEARKQTTRAHHTAHSVSVLDWTPPDPLPPLETSR